MAGHDPEVDVKDTKTSKLEVGLQLVKWFAIFIGTVWIGSGVVGVIEAPTYLNSAFAQEIFNALTPIVTATGFGTLIAYIVKNGNGNGTASAKTG